ncbi:hypothetical protein M422DRAFT_29072 [Sphaerobolus stellatus SS14]|uniref:AB hydrolase-1 domain-containing protein n=1 Tax=Sphaerobolus stellatus (strain SS14) TaxID=990650 RepID=A0A0C9UUZ4_SPHS4|nr:hypothetical protein M422DRAFT_29072 [Sphaerobolus stellatus SS14]
MAVNHPRIEIVKSNDGTEIYAEATGNKSKPTVAFVHGLGLSSVVWDAQFLDSELTERIYAIRYDLRGHGRSGKPLEPAAWTSERFAEDFHAVMSIFRVNKPILVGWSYGCTPAVDLATKFGPNYLRALVYVGGLPYTHAGHIVTDVQRSDVRSLLRQPNQNAFQEARGSNLRKTFGDPDSIPVTIYEQWAKATSMQPQAVFLEVLRRKQDTTHLWEQCGPILPLLVIHGQADRICDHDAAIKEARLKFKNVDIESWPSVGHAPFLENKEKFNSVITSWVAKVTSEVTKSNL